MHEFKKILPVALVAVGLTALATAAPVMAAPFDEAFAPASDGGLSAAPASPRDGETLETTTDNAQPIAAAPTAPKPNTAFKASFVVSQFVDVPVAGDAANTVRYSGRADAYINVGGTNFGLADDSITLNFRPEYTWGKTSNGTIGLIPNNTALFRPEGAGDFDLGINVRKVWKNGTNLTVGKINSLDLVGTLPIVGSDGHYGFQNLGLAFPPTAVIPNTWVGVLLEVPKKDWIFRAWVYDPDSQYERTGFETAFESGVAFLGAATRIARIGGKPGFYTVALVGSTRTGPAVDILPRALTPPPGGNFGDARGELAVQLSAYQYLSLNPARLANLQGLLGKVYPQLTVEPATDPELLEDGSVRWTIQAERRIIQQVNAVFVTQLIQGLDSSNAQAELEDNLPLLSQPKISLTPSWWPWVPIVPFRIEVVTQ